MSPLQIVLTFWTSNIFSLKELKIIMTINKQSDNNKEIVPECHGVFYYIFRPSVISGSLKT